MNGLKLSLLLLLCTFGLTVSAQEPIAIYDRTNVYREALELFDHEKYVPAKEKFEQFIVLESDPQNALRVNSEYYRGICALYLFHADAEYLLETFVREHPDSPWKQHAYFELATFNYKKKSYKKALEWFQEVDESTLSNKERVEFRYKRGHCYFETGDMKAARADFLEAKQEESDYKQAATYYYSHIAYEQNDLQTALEGFKQLENDPNFKPIVPYYISQIYYKQKKYEELLAYAPAVLDSANNSNTKRAPEIARLIGDAYFIKEKYTDALPYLERYHQATNKSEIQRQDWYQLGYVYYRVNQYQKAIDAYSNCADATDELGQLSTYNVADCYLKLDQKEYARNAFGDASKMAFNQEVQEDAMFNYSKLAFELSYNPFHEAITAFEDYLNTYPNSPRRDEAYEFLLNVYMKTRNYEKALASLDKIKNKDNNVKEAFQVVAYNRGVELFQATQYEEAEKYFDKVATYPINQMLLAEANFWKAEGSFNRQDYTKARERYAKFLSEPGAFNSEFYGLAHYGTGYCYFKQANQEDVYEIARDIYANANTAFRKFVDGGGVKDPRKLNDAYLRIGDCFYVNKSYTQAIQYYDKVSDNSLGNRDYAMYQKAMSYGYEGLNDKKAWVLKNLLSEMPQSKFEVDAKYELAKSYLVDNRLSEAKTYYNDILAKHAATSYAKLALVDLCLVYVKENNAAKVKETWNQLYANYPNDKVLVDAVSTVRSTLIEDSQFQQQLRDMKILNVSDEDIEDDVFAKASEPAYAGNCDLAVEKLKSYLAQFQPGFHRTEANYLLAECYFNSQDFTNALASYMQVVNAPLSDYSEEAHKVAATINYNNKNYDEARVLYGKLEQIAVLKTNLLEAQIGMMRCNYFIGEKTAAVEYANKVLDNSATPDEIKVTAYLWRGRVRLDNAEYAGAKSDFNEVLKRGGINGAEAKYHIAEIYFQTGEFKKAETEVFQLVEKFSPYEEWKYKGFLLLVDIYVGMNDLYQARSTVNAILSNVEEQWVLDAANQKSAELDALEGNSNGSRQSTQDVEIDLGGSSNE